jgi:hypothetical protein
MEARSGSDVQIDRQIRGGGDWRTGLPSTSSSSQVRSCTCARRISRMYGRAIGPSAISRVVSPILQVWCTCSETNRVVANPAHEFF